MSWDLSMLNHSTNYLRTKPIFRHWNINNRLTDNDRQETTATNIGLASLLLRGCVRRGEVLRINIFAKLACRLHISGSAKNPARTQSREPLAAMVGRPGKPDRPRTIYLFPNNFFSKMSAPFQKLI